MRSKSADLPGRHRRSAILGRQRSPETAARPKPQNRVRRGLAPSRPDMCRFAFGAADYIAPRRRSCPAVSQRGGGVEGGQDLGDAQPAATLPTSTARAARRRPCASSLDCRLRALTLSPATGPHARFFPARARGLRRLHMSPRGIPARICPPKFACCLARRGCTSRSVQTSK